MADNFNNAPLGNSEVEMGIHEPQDDSYDNVIYHPNQFQVDFKWRNNTDMTKEEVTELAKEMTRQSESVKQLGPPELYQRPEPGNFDPTNEEYF